MQRKKEVQANGLEEKEIHSMPKMRTQAIGCICKYKSTVGYPDKEL